jgi:F1F0 ATPase subunit 2
VGNLVTLIPAFAAGVLLGSFFFGALRLTIQYALPLSTPGLWFLASLLLRTIIVLAGFQFIGHGDWRRLLAALLGFVLARFAIMRLTRAMHAPRAQFQTGGRL